MLEPSPEALFAPAVFQRFDPLADLSYGQNAQVQRLVRDVLEPLHHATLRFFPHDLGNDVRVQKVTHRSTGLAGERLRPIRSSTFASGDSRRKRTKDGLRPVRRVKSRFETTTAAGRPRNVISCGPSRSADCTTSLSRAFASWSCQRAMIVLQLVRLVRRISSVKRSYESAIAGPSPRGRQGHAAGLPCIAGPIRSRTYDRGSRIDALQRDVQRHGIRRPAQRDREKRARVRAPRGARAGRGGFSLRSDRRAPRLPTAALLSRGD